MNSFGAWMLDWMNQNNDAIMAVLFVIVALVAVITAVVMIVALVDGNERQAYIDRNCLSGHYEDRTETYYDVALKMPRTRIVRVFRCDKWKEGMEP